MRRTARSSEAARSASGAKTKRGAPPPGPRGLRGKAPQRTCVACRTTRAKRELVRVVRSPSGELSVDLRGKAPGRGAYLDPDDACLERGLADGALARALEIEIDATKAERLRQQLKEAANVRKTNA